MNYDLRNKENDRKNYAPQNTPSRLYISRLGWDVLLQDQRYCAGHSSNRKAHKIYSRILRAKLKEEFKRNELRSYEQGE